MDLHQSVPPPYNNLYPSAPPSSLVPLVPLVPLQRSQSLQYGPGTVPSNFHPLNTPQPRQSGHGFAHQHYIPQQSQLQAQATPRFVSHASQSHHVQRVPPHLIPHTQHPPLQHPQHQQQYNLPVHHHVVPIPISQPIAVVGAHRVENQLQPPVVARPDLQQHEHKPDAHLEGLRLVPNPPDLGTWRQRLFNVDDMIVVSEEE